MNTLLTGQTDLGGLSSTMRVKGEITNSSSEYGHRRLTTYTILFIHSDPIALATHAKFILNTNPYGSWGIGINALTIEPMLIEYNGNVQQWKMEVEMTRSLNEPPFPPITDNDYDD